MRWILEELAENMVCPYATRNCQVNGCIAWENKGDWLIDNGEESDDDSINIANRYGRCTACKE